MGFRDMLEEVRYRAHTHEHVRAWQCEAQSKASLHFGDFALGFGSWELLSFASGWRDAGVLNPHTLPQSHLGCVLALQQGILD